MLKLILAGKTILQGHSQADVASMRDKGQHALSIALKKNDWPQILRLLDQGAEPIPGMIERAYYQKRAEFADLIKRGLVPSERIIDCIVYSEETDKLVLLIEAGVMDHQNLKDVIQIHWFCLGLRLALIKRNLHTKVSCEYIAYMCIVRFENLALADLIVAGTRPTKLMLERALLEKNHGAVKILLEANAPVPSLFDERTGFNFVQHYFGYLERHVSADNDGLVIRDLFARQLRNYHDTFFLLQASCRPLFHQAAKVVLLAGHYRVDFYDALMRYADEELRALVQRAHEEAVFRAAPAYGVSSKDVCISLNEH